MLHNLFPPPRPVRRSVAVLLLCIVGISSQLTAVSQSHVHTNSTTLHDSLRAVDTLSQFIAEHYYQLFATPHADPRVNNNRLSTPNGGAILNGTMYHPAYLQYGVIKVNTTTTSSTVQTTVSLYHNHNNVDEELQASYSITQRRSSHQFINLSMLIHRYPTVRLSLSQSETSRLHQSSVSLWLEQNNLYRDIPLQTSIKAILLSGWHEILRHSSHAIAWNSLLKTGRKSANIPIMVDAIRPLLPLLPDADDGAMNQYGELVAIETGAIRNNGGGFNCSGFSKWIVDSIYFPITNSYLALDALTSKHYGLRGTGWSTIHEENRDPYFGLDWSRALAYNLLQVQTAAFHNKTFSELQTVIDVTNDTHYRHLPNIGYATTDLYQLLYQLSLTEPDTFYIGSLNGEFLKKNEQGITVPLRQHFHIVVFFPYFDQHDNFQIAVFERNTEVAIKGFIHRNRHYDIHLVRLKAIDANFMPPQLQSHG